MSEFITQQTLERDVNNALDKVLPYEPYERTASDIVLVEEAELLADTRIKHLYEIFDEEGTRGTLRRSVRADAFYDEHYSGIDWREDANLLGLTMFKLSGTQILCKYGSDEVRNDIGLQFANKYSYSANKTILNCVHHRFAIRQAEDYLKAAYDFTEELHLLDHLGEDHMLLEPFVKLGTSLADVFLEPGSGFADMWQKYLQNKVLGVEDLVGEDRRVGDDMTASMLSWVEARVLEFKVSESFREPPEEYCYGYDPGEEEADEQDEFSVYGSDAPYFREVKRRREELEKAETGSIQ